MLSKESRLGLRTWIEIDRSAIAHNYDIFREIIPTSVKLMSVVKSNAYGHGLVDFSKEISKHGIDWLGVDSIVEALRLRKEGITVPILVLGYTLPERIQEAVDNNISITLSSMYSAEEVSYLMLHEKISVHIKVDTGMHRQGFMNHELETVLTFLKQHEESIHVEGLYTHFAAAKDLHHPEYIESQLALFKQWIESFRKAGFSPLTHAAASGATLLFPETHFDMVRIGISMHGLWPSSESEEALKEKYTLEPTLSWKTIISELKTVPKGEQVGYDFTETLSRDTRLAICPIGYWHGYWRSLSSVGQVLVNGKRAKVIGRVSMDMITIDVTDTGAPKVGDEVVLIGHSGDEYLGVSELARLGNVASVYEFVTRINPLIKKIYI